jgi:hypothetical protein
MNILDTIIEKKITEVASNKASVSEDELKNSDLFTRSTFSLKAFLLCEMLFFSFASISAKDFS